MTDTLAEKIHQYFSKYPKRTYPKGQFLIFADEDPEYIFYMLSGRVRKYDISYRGDEVVVNVFKPPAFFPMSWAVNGTHNLFFFKTKPPPKLIVWPAEATGKF